MAVSLNSNSVYAKQPLFWEKYGIQDVRGGANPRGWPNFLGNNSEMKNIGQKGFGVASRVCKSANDESPFGTSFNTKKVQNPHVPVVPFEYSDSMILVIPGNPCMFCHRSAIPGNPCMDQLSFPQRSVLGVDKHSSVNTVKLQEPEESMSVNISHYPANPQGQNQMNQ